MKLLKLAIGLLTVFFISSPGYSQSNFWKQTNGPFGGNISSFATNRAGYIFTGTFGGSIRGDSELTIGSSIISLPARQIKNTELASSSLTYLANKGDTFFTFMKPSIGLYIDVGVALGYQSPIMSIDYVPTSVRDVPVHRNDVWRSGENGGIIPNEEVFTPSGFFGQSQARAGITLGISNLQVILGGFLLVHNVHSTGYKLKDNPTDPNDAIRRRNYQGNSEDIGTERRGVGTALTYYRIPDDGDGVEWNGVFARVELDIGKTVDDVPLSVFAEYAQQTSASKVLMLESGWDRYNSLEAYQMFVVADIEHRLVSLGIRGENSLGYSRVSLDLYRPKVTLHDADQQPSVRVKNAFSISVGFGFKLSPGFLF